MWHCEVFVFVRLISLCTLPSKYIHVIANDRISFFSWQITILLCVYHIFFIHSYVDGYLGCFHILAAANIAAVNIGVHVFSQIIVLGFFIY